MSVQQGTFDPLKIYKIFRSLHDRRVEGILDLGAGKVTKRLAIRAGRPISVRSNLKRDGLLPTLLARGDLSPDQVRQAQAFRQEQGASEEAAALRLGFLSPDQLRAGMAWVARSRLLDVFRWPSGTFAFAPQSAATQSFYEPIDVIDMLLEAAASYTAETVCEQFVASFAGQGLRLAPWDDRYGERYDALFGSPNPRACLATSNESSPSPIPPGSSARQVFGLVIAGLSVFGVMTPRSSPPQSAPEASQATPPQAAPPQPAKDRKRPETAAVDAPGRRAPESNAATADPSRLRSDRVNGSRGSRGTYSVSIKRRADRQAPSQDSDSKLQMSDDVRSTLTRVAELTGTLSSMSHYALLEVNKKSKTAEIRARFRELARELHVDRFARFQLPREEMKAVQRVFMAMNRAQQVLRDPDLRREYDLSLEMQAKGQRGVSQAGADVTSIFEAEQLTKDGTILLRNGKPAAAVEKFAIALKTTPNDVLAQAGHAYAEFLTNRADGRSNDVALAAQERLVKLGTPSVRSDLVHLYVGRVHRALDRFAEATTSFERALKINPHCAEAASELRYLQKKSEQPRHQSARVRKPGRGLLDRFRS